MRFHLASFQYVAYLQKSDIAYRQAATKQYSFIANLQLSNTVILPMRN